MATVEDMLCLPLEAYFLKMLMLDQQSSVAYKKRSLTHLVTDVARPDKISGADINAICQEVNI